jgi:8-oxo-dGTP pyrophosphatase MutT (NUDIX family)/phosphohistidine phosphatase SixA
MPDQQTDRQESLAAGAIAVRRRADRTEVLVIHRPRHDDWTFPKGHIDPGEHLLAAAVREVHEETGVTVRLGPPLPPLAYGLPSGITKVVRFWLATQCGDNLPEPLDTREVDLAEWVDLEQVADRLTYDDERNLVASISALMQVGPTVALVVLRHAHAKSRSSWRDDDNLRPLNRRGGVEAASLESPLSAFGLRRLLSSDAVRCVHTLRPLAISSGLEIETDPALSEQGTPEHIRATVIAARNKAVASGEPALICSHRPTLPDVFATLDVPPVPLTAGAFVVVHLDGSGSAISQEQYGP